MTPNITTLALNLLISERKSQRLHFSEKILNSKPLKAVLKKSPDLKINLVIALEACIENPSCEERKIFYKIVESCELAA